MDLDHFSDYFATEKRQKWLRNITMIMFIVLAVEKLISSVDADYSGGRLQIYSAINFLDVICIGVYLTTAVLIGVHVRYERIVFPDFVLLGVKLCIIVTDVLFLLTQKDASLIDKFSAGEHIIEAVLFAAFLICMFIGELSHGKKLPNFAHVCMNLLMICFPVTVLLETAKMIIAYELHQNLYVTAFNFVRDVLNEAFLDVPYFLLILMVCLTSNRGHKTVGEG